MNIPWPKLGECTIVAFVDRPIRGQDTAKGIPDQNAVIVLPIIDDSRPPPTKEPMMYPNKKKVAEV